MNPCMENLCKNRNDDKLQNLTVADDVYVFVVLCKFSEGKVTENILSILEMPDSYLDLTKCLECLSVHASLMSLTVCC
jgi:hypothetical protein